MEDDAYPELYRPDPYITELRGTREILNLPLTRTLSLRPGKPFSILHAGSTGLINYKATLAYQRGTQPSNDCGCVAPKPWGPFKQCVVLGTAFGGACMNCVYNAKASRCSFRSSRCLLNPYYLYHCLHPLTMYVVGDDTASTLSHPDQIAGSATPATELQASAAEQEDRDSDKDFEADPGDSAGMSSSPVHTRRQAAKDAESKMSKYTYRVADANDSDGTGGGVTGETVLPPIKTPHGVDIDGAVSAGMSRPAKPRAGTSNDSMVREHNSSVRGPFKARRGGLRGSAHSFKKSKGGENAASRKRPATFEDSDDQPLAEWIYPTLDSDSDDDDDEPPPQLKKSNLTNTSTTHGQHQDLSLQEAYIVQNVSVIFLCLLSPRNNNFLLEYHLGRNSASSKAHQSNAKLVTNDAPAQIGLPQIMFPQSHSEIQR